MKKLRDVSRVSCSRERPDIISVFFVAKQSNRKVLFVPAVRGYGGKACLFIHKHEHFTPTREIKRHVRALARNHPAGWKLQGHVSPASTNYLTYRISISVVFCNAPGKCSLRRPSASSSVASVCPSVNLWVDSPMLEADMGLAWWPRCWFGMTPASPSRRWTTWPRLRTTRVCVGLESARERRCYLSEQPLRSHRGAFSILVGAGDRC